MVSRAKIDGNFHFRAYVYFFNRVNKPAGRAIYAIYMDSKKRDGSIQYFVNPQ